MSVCMKITTQLSKSSFYKSNDFLFKISDKGSPCVGGCSSLMGLVLVQALEALTLGASSRFKNNYFTEICSGSEEGSYLRLIDFFITQLYSNNEEEEEKEALTLSAGRRASPQSLSLSLFLTLSLTLTVTLSQSHTLTPSHSLTLSLYHSHTHSLSAQSFPFYREADGTPRCPDAAGVHL